MLVHGLNLEQKENLVKKYNDEESKQFLSEIRVQYDAWHKANEDLKGPLSVATDKDHEIINHRIVWFEQYKNFIDQQKYAEKFDSRSNLHSSVLEQFIYYLFRDMVHPFSEYALLGKSHTFKDIFFSATNFKEMVSMPNVKFEKKDHDFAIGVIINAKMSCAGNDKEETHAISVPAIAIECKTYLDKNMLEGSSKSAEELKHRNPNALYFIVAEWLKLTEDINLKKYKVDQIYILRRQKNTDREYRYAETYKKNPIFEDVVLHLFSFVRSHLNSDWEGGVGYGLTRGYLL